MTNPSRSLQDAQTFLTLLGGAEDARFTFQTFDDSPEKRKQLAHIYHGTFAERADDLVRMNDQRAGVFVTVNETNGEGRRYSNVTRVRALFVDLDGQPLESLLKAAADPQLIIESSPGRWHGYWLVSDCPLEAFKRCQQALIERFGSDKSINDLPRVMRIPGFIHAKHDPFTSRIHQLNERPHYTLAELAQAFGFDPAPPVALARAPSVAPLPTSSADRDRDDDLRDALGRIPSDEYSVWIRIGHALKTLGEGAAALWIEWSSRSAKFDLKVATERWATFHPEQTDYKVVFAEAKNHGWDPRESPSAKRRRAAWAARAGERPPLPDAVPEDYGQPRAQDAPEPTQEQLKPDTSAEALVARYELIYGTRSVWDCTLKVQMGYSAFADLVGREAAKQWLEGGKRRVRMPMAGAAASGGAGRKRKREDEGPPDTTKVDEMLPRYALIYGYEAVFDHEKRMELSLGALRAYCGLKAVRDWGDHPRRQVVDQEQVIFSPRRPLDDKTYCNLWGGWPIQATAGSAEDQVLVQRWLKILYYLTGELDNLADGASDAERAPIATWILRWFAYPLKHPGTKLTTSLILHGPEGSGKNTICNAVRRIYGRYGIQIMQTQLEQQWCDWISAKLFIVGNEVLHRQEQVQQKGRLKTLISDPTVRVERKFLPGRQEENFANMVFLSNELQPLSLDPGDRRFLVVWTPNPHPDGYEFYKGLGEDSMPDSAVQALYHHLLHNVELGDFNPHTKPPMTTAKQDLIEVSLESHDRFIRDWLANELPVSCRPCRAQHLYRAYMHWCRDNGERFPKPENKFGARAKKEMRAARKWFADGTVAVGRRQAMFYLPPNVDPPPGTVEANWLGDHQAAFRAQLQEWINDPLA